MNPFNSDAYDKGFEQGKKDALAGKKRNIFPAKELLRGIFAFNSNVYVKSYIEGYRKGYETTKILQSAKEQGFKNTKQEKLTFNQSNNTNMEQDFEVQKGQLEELYSFLNLFKEEIGEKIQNYQIRVDNMHHDGLTKQVYNKFQIEHIDKTKALVRQIIDLIENDSIPFIQGNILIMEDAIKNNQ